MHASESRRGKSARCSQDTINLYTMFYSSLGLGSTIMFAQFVEFAIFDTIKVRK